MQAVLNKTCKLQILDSRVCLTSCKRVVSLLMAHHIFSVWHGSNPPPPLLAFLFYAQLHAAQPNNCVCHRMNCSHAGSSGNHASPLHSILASFKPPLLPHYISCAVARTIHDQSSFFPPQHPPFSLAHILFHPPLNLTTEESRFRPPAPALPSPPNKNQTTTPPSLHLQHQQHQQHIPNLPFSTTRRMSKRKIIQS